MKMLNIETQLQNALKPVTPRADFVSQLKVQLTQPKQTLTTSSPFWLIVAGIGGLVSVASVLLLIVRVSAALFRRVSEALPRPRRMATARASN